MSRPHEPHCEACSRPERDVPLMLSVRKGGMPTHLCSDCLAELHATAQRVLRMREMDRAAD
jgi:hypothetical protein